MPNLNDILALLPALSREELDVVVATAQALARSRPRAGNRRGPGPSKKGPKAMKSPYSGKPEYEAFKAGEVALHLYLKDVGKKLSEVAPAGPETPGLAEPVRQFFELRNRWFRAKAADKVSASGAAASAAASATPAPARPEKAGKEAGKATAPAKTGP